MSKIKTGIDYIKEERERQIKEEGWTPEHDDMHINGELANAAACYAMTESERKGIQSDGRTDVPLCWPWDPSWWKPTPDNRIKELAKVGALAAAEIDRLLREEYKDYEKE